MPTFIPPYHGEEIKSNAEKKMFTVLQDLQLKNTYILHSLGLPKHQSKIYGEIDFVVVCETGISCLEIKGGRVECREGQWYFTDRYGHENKKPEGPFSQVVGNMFSLKQNLQSAFPQNPHMKNILMGCGVVFLDIEFLSSSQEIINEIVYDRKTGDITEYFRQMFDYWEKRQHRECSKLSPKDIADIVGYLRGEFCFIPTLGSRLEDVEEKLIRLTAEQAAVMEALAQNDHLLVEGGAGTGKTLLAVDYAKREALQGRRVLYLTYNKNLAYDITEKMGSEFGTLKVINIHALFGEYVTVDFEKIQDSPHTYFSEELPEDFLDYVAALPNQRLQTMQFDTVVIDEGQDLMKPTYIYCVDSILKGGLERGRWAVFYDENQNIYNQEFEAGKELLQSYPSTRFKLLINCRNTIQIGRFNAKASKTALTCFLRENGEEVSVMPYSNQKDFSEQVISIIKKLRDERVVLDDIVFLSPKRYANSDLKGVLDKVCGVNILSDQMDRQAGKPMYSTIPGFKGLDAKVVVTIDMDKVRKDMFFRYMYIAFSRARGKLIVMMPEGVEEL